MDNEPTPTTDATGTGQRDDDTDYLRQLLRDMMDDPKGLVAAATPTTLAEAGYTVQLGRVADTFFVRVGAERADGRRLKLDAEQPITADRGDAGFERIDRIELWSGVLRRIIAWWETGTDADDNPAPPERD